MAEDLQQELDPGGRCCLARGLQDQRLLIRVRLDLYDPASPLPTHTGLRQVVQKKNQKCRIADGCEMQRSLAGVRGRAQPPRPQIARTPT
jgi:hypothetical protein